MAVSIGTLIETPIAGAVQERGGGQYGGLIVFAGFLYLPATGAFILTRGVCAGWSLKPSSESDKDIGL
jgi:hypothetical protein